jgi:hypothetical protein
VRASVAKDQHDHDHEHEAEAAENQS